MFADLARERARLAGAKNDAGARLRRNAAWWHFWRARLCVALVGSRRAMKSPPLFFSRARPPPRRRGSPGLQPRAQGERRPFRPGTQEEELVHRVAVPGHPEVEPRSECTASSTSQGGGAWRKEREAKLAARSTRRASASRPARHRSWADAPFLWIAGRWLAMLDAWVDAFRPPAGQGRGGRARPCLPLLRGGPSRPRRHAPPLPVLWGAATGPCRGLLRAPDRSAVRRAPASTVGAPSAARSQLQRRSPPSPSPIFFVLA
jgi:hypothetical protein